MSDLIPAEVFPLAEYLSDEIEARGWTTTDVALRMGSESAEQLGRDLLALDILMCIQSDKLLVDDKQLCRIARAFDVSPQFLRNLDDVWRRHPERRAPFSPPECIFGPVSRRALIRAVPSP